MLRLIVGVRRRPSETWVEYMQRSTWRSEELKVQVDRLVRSPAKTQATDGTKSENYAVRPLASPHTQMDAMVSHKHNKK